MLNPSKVKFQYIQHQASKIYFFICTQIEIHIFILLKHGFNHFQVHHMHVFLNYNSWM
jgi:hypothetical protein